MHVAGRLGLPAVKWSLPVPKKKPDLQWNLQQVVINIPYNNNSREKNGSSEF